VGGAQVSAALPAQQVICWVLVLSLPLTLPATWWLRPQQPASGAAWGGFAYVSLFSMWLGFFAWYRGLALGGVMRVSQVQLLQPFLALLFAVPILGERLEPATLGFALAVMAVVFVGRRMPAGGRDEMPGDAGRHELGVDAAVLPAAEPGRGRTAGRPAQRAAGAAQRGLRAAGGDADRRRLGGAARCWATPARGLRAAGAEGLVLATNTMHKVADAIEAAAGLPLLHIADATGAALRPPASRASACWARASRWTTRQHRAATEVQHPAPRPAGAVVPGDDDRAEVHRVIYDELCRGAGARQRARASALWQAIERLRAQGCAGVILGCTEITLLVDAACSPLPVFDSTAAACRGGRRLDADSSTSATTWPCGSSSTAPMAANDQGD
jgi:aspartate/glutamate racemase/uncharacterized membrane protein